MMATFNANNLFVQYRFGSTFAGAPATAAAPTPPAAVDPATTARTKYGFLPRYEDASFEAFNVPQRELAARALTRGGEHPLPDLVTLQEIESLIALRVFNERYLGRHYTQALPVDSRDHRQIDVGFSPRLRCGCWGQGRWGFSPGGGRRSRRSGLTSTHSAA